MQTELLNPATYPVASMLYSASNLIESDDDQLVVETRAGSASAFEALVQRYESRVFRLALRFAPTREDAEEIMQNAFLKAFNNLHLFRGDSRFYTWLVRITINEGLMKVRRRRTQEVSIDDFLETEDRAVPRELEDWGPNPEQQYSQEELQNILSATIARLPMGNRIVFQLRDVEGFSTEEVSEALHVSPTAVKARLRRARFQLRQLLNPYLKRSAGRKFMPVCRGAVAVRRAA